MPNTKRKEQHAAPETFDRQEIERLENYPDAQRVNLDEVVADSVARSKRQGVRKRR